MSKRNLESALPERDAVNIEQVCQFLECHPEFFNEHDELLERLRVPHHRGGTISLVERQTEVLRKRIREQESRLARLIENGRENEKLFQKTRELTLALLDAGSLDEVSAAIEDGFREHFDTDACSLILLEEQFGQSSGNVRTISQSELAQQASGIATLDQPRGGAFPEPLMKFMFVLHEHAMQSAMIAPVLGSAPADRLGLLVLGSTDRSHFHETLGTDFLSYIGEVLARALEPHRTA